MRTKGGGFWVCGLVAFCLAGPIRLSAGDRKDPKAVEVAQALRQALGGDDAWQKAHFVRFDFIVAQGPATLVDRSHLWDQWTGRYRYEERMKDGRVKIVLFNTATKKGQVFLGGTRVPDGQANKDLDDAYAAYINDMWWLAMPWKWMDPGVNLKYLGSTTRGHETDDEVELTFNHVGLTPGDRYHALVSRKSHLMTHWDYVLQSHEKGSWDWEYGETHGMKLASNHRSSDGKTTINMGVVRVLDAVDDAFFTDPARRLAELK
jgi:hypothetical protein